MLGRRGGRGLSCLSNYKTDLSSVLVVIPLSLAGQALMSKGKRVNE
jgi:hypothetical protein